MSFLAELRRRNVIRMAGLYLVGAWLLVQVAETLLPIFDTPGWVLKTLVVLLAIGFIPALVFSWIYELTPDGLRRESEAAHTRSVDATARKLDVAVILLLLAVAAMVWFKPAATVGLAPPTSPGETATTEGDAGSSRSIAVLPFVNMSSDPEQEYFSDGISEEILNVLARQPALQVAARTSSFSFKGGKHEVPEIAAALNVRMVLEGSVRKQGDRVRITAQLIDARSGFHLWSETYDRELEDIFAVQDEIATAIASALQVTLKPLAGDGDSRSRNIEAYDLYLQGLSLWQTRTSGESLWQAIGLFERALAIDPGSVDPLVGLALAYAVIPDYSERISTREADLLAFDHALRALALDDQLPETYAVLGSVLDGQSRYEAAHALLRRAQALRPSYATAYQWLGTSLMSSGQLEPALQSVERASELDPRSPVILMNHAHVLMALDRNDDAITVCRKALAFVPSYRFCLALIADAFLHREDLEQAEANYLLAAQSGKPASSDLIRRVFSALRGESDALPVVTELLSFPTQSAVDPASPNIFFEWQLAPLLLRLGHPESALDYLESTVRQGGGESISWALVLPALDPIRCEARFQALIAGVRALDPHHERVCAETTP